MNDVTELEVSHENLIFFLNLTLIPGSNVCYSKFA